MGSTYQCEHGLVGQVDGQSSGIYWVKPTLGTDLSAMMVERTFGICYTRLSLSLAHREPGLEARQVSTRLLSLVELHVHFTKIHQMWFQQEKGLGTRLHVYQAHAPTKICSP